MKLENSQDSRDDELIWGDGLTRKLFLELDPQLGPWHFPYNILSCALLKPDMCEDTDSHFLEEDLQKAVILLHDALDHVL